MKTACIAAIAACSAPLFLGAPAHAQVDPYIGQVIIVPYTFCPRGTTEMAGQLLPINNNQALFSLLGTTYGGDGRTSFAIPETRGRTTVGVGSGPGLPTNRLGEKFGAASVTLNIANLPLHAHALEGAQPGPPGGGRGQQGGAATGSQVATGAGQATALQTGAAGGGQPVAIQPPSLVLRYCIALQGIFPSRS
jgi:microcystin-dependent protein